MNTKQLKQKILSLAITGRLVPQDPSDEPASELLHRINPKVEPIQDNVPYEIPDNWEWCRIKDVFIINPKNKVADETEAGFVPMGNISGGFSDEFKAEIKKWKDIRHNFTHFANGDIAVAKISPCLENRKSMILRGLPNGIGAGTTELHVFRPLCVVPKFFLYFAKTDYFINKCTSDFSGTVGQKRAGRAVVASVFFPLPPLAEQKRIAEAVERWFAKIDQLEHDCEALSKFGKQVRKKLLTSAITGRLVPQDPNDEPASELLKSIREEKARLVKEGKLPKDKNETLIFRGDDKKFYEQKGKTVTCIDDQIPLEIPDSWEWCRMGSIGDWGAGATPYKSEPKYYGGDILWLRTGELNNGVVYDTEIKITEKALKECSLRMNKEGDVLIAMYGATIGKLAIAGKEMTTNQACCGCAPLGIYNYYLFYFLMASKADLVGKGEGGAQPNISKEKLVNHLIPIPPLAEQKRIVEKLESMFAVLDNLDALTA